MRVQGFGLIVIPLLIKYLLKREANPSLVSPGPLSFIITRTNGRISQAKKIKERDGGEVISEIEAKKYIM